MSAEPAAPTIDLDLGRPQRTGLGEVVFGEGKTCDEVVAAATGLFTAHGRVLVTRAGPEALAALSAAIPTGRADARARGFLAGAPPATLGPVALISAGTADQAVARECALTLAIAGVQVETFADCGIAGLHRVLRHLPAIRRCRCAIVVAGMDGALPAVVAGQVDLPVIACPTPIGYGVAAGGTAALQTMLASCAPGLAVVNIGNGFGAAAMAAAICRQIRAG
ncbi:1-(5-phosphoribosyl)-5-amino-4-imidazole-carboxylate carboxylase [Planctomycetota bacterium]|nr:1-(5-phosphoribosyl)-5-amino-4-imidazole-carboxylate carboxylase [Planctomycetota bacterium]